MQNPRFLKCYSVGLVVTWWLVLWSAKAEESLAEVNFTDFLLEEINATNIRENLRFLSSEPHLAGTPRNNELAEHIATLWRQYEFDSVKKVQYKVLLSYPDPDKPNKVELLDSDGHSLFTSRHMEDILRPEDQHETFVPMFNSYSPNGTVEGDLIYVHYGRPEDFHYLVSNGIDLGGKIVIAQYGKNYRGNKVRLAAQYGAAGIILYNDPHQSAQEGEHPSQVYPSSWWLQGSGAQRGSIWSRGDPLSLHDPAIEGIYQTPVEEADLPKIPCQPISTNDARRLLQLLNGTSIPPEWRSSTSIAQRLGPGFLDDQPAQKVRLTVNNQLNLTDIVDVIGIIKGATEPDRYVLAGNHRDSWGFGAVDASSGTAQMLEVTRIFGELLKQGWRPRRTIVFCSWDAEEFGLIGSYEFVEENLVKLSQRAVVYINTDSCPTGTRFEPGASPFLSHLVINASKMIPAPGNTSITLYEEWLQDQIQQNKLKNGNLIVKLSRGGSDHVPFGYYAGIPTIYLNFIINGQNYRNPLSSYPTYHTGFDTFYVVDQFMDPQYNYMKSCALLNGLLLNMISEAELLPFNATNYAQTVVDALNELKATTNIYNFLINNSLPVDRLEAGIQKFVTAANEWQQRSDNLNTTDPLIIRGLNDQISKLEQNMVNFKGVPLQPRYRHLIFALGLHNMYEDASFPGIRDLIHEIQHHPTQDLIDPRMKLLEHHVSDLILAIHQSTKFLQPVHII